MTTLPDFLSNKNKNMIMRKPRSFIFILIPLITLFNLVCETSAQNNRVEQGNGRIRIAACQFPVSAVIQENYQYIEAQITEAKLKKADVAQFPECALSGYPGTDMMSLENFNWNEL